MKPAYNIEDLRDWREPNLRFAVLGDPVAHSASPAMHNAALEYLGSADRYCRLHILPDDLVEAVQLLRKIGFRGVNLTVPHKTQILPLLDEIDEHARRLGAVNTVKITDGRLLGCNTDGPGIVRSIREEFKEELGDLRVLILGAGGGAGRAIATQCVMEGCPKIVLMNRTKEKIIPLVAMLGSSAEAADWNDASIKTFLPEADLIINASTVGMNSTDTSPIPAWFLDPNLLVYDTIYVGARTPLQVAADDAGATSANGLSLLLHQGVLALEFWLGKPVPVEVMRRGLLNHIASRSH